MEQRLDRDGEVLPRRPARCRRSAAPQNVAGDGDRDAPQPEELVLSEVHLECQHPLDVSATTTMTAFHTADGAEVVSVAHALATPLRSVGLQVWRGALLLADYVLHLASQQRSQHGSGGAFCAAPLRLLCCTALELGAGSGLAGLVLSAFARRVYLTDTGGEVLANCQLNAQRHLHRAAPPPGSSGGDASRGASGRDRSGGDRSGVCVRQLDWLDPPDWLLPPEQQEQAQQQEQQQQRGQGLALELAKQQEQQRGGDAGGTYGWSQADRQELQQVDLLLAADPVYEDVLTESFMRSATLLMRYAGRHSGRRARLLVALERRVVFTIVEQRAAAPVYDYWRTRFEAEGSRLAPLAAASSGAVLAALLGAKQQQRLRRLPFRWWGAA